MNRPSAADVARAISTVSPPRSSTMAPASGRRAARITTRPRMLPRAGDCAASECAAKEQAAGIASITPTVA